MSNRLLTIVSLTTFVGCNSVLLASDGSVVSQLSGTQPAITVSPHDVAFYMHNGSVQSQYRNATCGYTILANRYSRQFPRPEWAISIHEVIDGDTPVVRVEATAYRVMSDSPKAPMQTRAPITALGFTVKGQAQPLIANIINSNGSTGQINAILETKPAQELFRALYYGYPLAISLAYQDETTDTLEVRNWSPANVSWELGYFQRCLNFLRPVETGIRYYLYELTYNNSKMLHSDVSYCFGPYDVAGPCRAFREDDKSEKSAHHETQ